MRRPLYFSKPQNYIETWLTWHCRNCGQSQRFQAYSWMRCHWQKCIHCGEEQKFKVRDDKE